MHAAYRAVRALLRWWDQEVELAGWKNPLEEVRAPEVPVEYLEPVSLADVRTMLETCDAGSVFGRRDRAVLLALLETGCRAREFLALSPGDLNLEAGDVIVRSGKGRKPRIVFDGQAARQVVAGYLVGSDCDATAPLWLTERGRGLSYTGLREIPRRSAGRASVAIPSLHSFRLAFALACLRRRLDDYSLQRHMGHSNLSVLRRYLELTVDDPRRGHATCAPVGRML